jgi:hypothetical protein
VAGGGEILGVEAGGGRGAPAAHWGATVAVESLMADHVKADYLKVSLTDLSALYLVTVTKKCLKADIKAWKK